MPKGYWIVRVDVTDPEAYKKYVAANAEPLARYGAQLPRARRRARMRRGKARARNVVVEFPSFEAARACYRRPRLPGAQELPRRRSDADFIIIEGYDGPQPGD